MEICFGIGILRNYTEIVYYKHKTEVKSYGKLQFKHIVL